MSEDKKIVKLEATWSLSLDCECPKCGEDIDLMDDDNFWENNNIQACEWGTKKSRDVDAYCEKCEHEFKVDLVY